MFREKSFVTKTFINVLKNLVSNNKVNIYIKDELSFKSLEPTLLNARAQGIEFHPY